MQLSKKNGACLRTRGSACTSSPYYILTPGIFSHYGSARLHDGSAHPHLYLCVMCGVLNCALRPGSTTRPPPTCDDEALPTP